MRTRTQGTLALLALSLTLAACGAAESPAKRPAASSLCDPAKLEVCERSIAEGLPLGRASRELVAAYASARAAASPDDPWAKLWSDLTAKGGEGAVIIAEAAKTEDIERGLTAPHRLVRTQAALPDPKGIPAETLLLAMGEAAAIQHIVRVRRAPDATTEIFPRDPLAPFLAGIPPVIRGGADAAAINLDIRAASLLRSAVNAASAFDYPRAATEAEALSALIDPLDNREKIREPVARARYALDLLGAAGLTLDPEREAEGPPPPAPEAPPPSPGDTPYGQLLHVKLARDQSAEWPARSASILAAIPESRRAAFAALFRSSSDCSPLAAPPIEGPRDLVFTGRLATALDKGVPSTARGVERLPLQDWYKRYEIVARAVGETRTMWSYGSSLLYERGEASGITTAGTSTFVSVSELGAQHIAAIQALERAFPARFRSLNHLGLVYSSGVLGDPPLRDAMLRLTQSAVQDKIARADAAKDVFEGALTAVFAALSFPPVVQEAYYMALRGAVTAKLKGDFLTRSGWGVAGLYAADAVFRIVTDQSPNLAFSAAQVARALGDPSVEMPGLAALATSLARYAALGADKRLDPEIASIDRFPPERRAAREALKNAVAGLGTDGSDAPANVLEDVTTLADGMIATLSLSLSERERPSNAVECPKKAKDGPSPAVRRAIARLSDVRRRVLLHPRYKTGDGVWIRRVRLLVTLLSDAMDFVGKTGARPVFTIADAAAERALSEALAELPERTGIDALGAAYSLARKGLAAKSADAFLQQNGAGLRRLLQGIALFFKEGAGEAADKKGGGVALLDALASVPLNASAEGDLLSSLVAYAEAFYAKGKLDQGDLMLLSTLVVSGLTDSPPSGAVLALAAKHSKRLSWPLHFIGDVRRVRAGSIPDPSSYEEGMREATDASCAVADPSDVLSVTDAIRRFSSGDPPSSARAGAAGARPPARSGATDARGAARADLDRALDAMEARGLDIPRITFKYEERTTHKIFTTSLGVSYGAGMLDNASSFQVGVGVISRGEPSGSMTMSLAPPDISQAGQEAARYFIHTAALAAALHFLDGDTDHAMAAARRAIDSLAFGVRLGGRVMPSPDPVAWGADARALLAIDAQLAAEAGLPFLAGDLFTMVRGSLAKDATDADIDDVLARAPFGLAAVKEAGPVRERAAKSLKVLAHKLACSEAKVELGGFEETTCEAYPLALSLRIADALSKLPRVRPGGGSRPICAGPKALDAFLSAAEKGTYDPDAFTAAVEERRAHGDIYSAAVLLSRQRRDVHCSPAIVAAARALGRTDALGPSLRADLLGVSINCGAGASAAQGAELTDDLLALDAETQRLADPTRSLRLLLSLTDLAVNQGNPAALVAITSRPGYIDRWQRVSPNAAAAALLIAYGAKALANRGANAPLAVADGGANAPLAVAGGSAAPPATKADEQERAREDAAYSLLCETFASSGAAAGGDRTEVCASIKALRPPFTGPAEVRQKRAKEALTKLLKDAFAPPAPPTPSP